LGSPRKTPTGQGLSPSPAAADALTTELDQLERLELGDLRVHYRNRSGRIAPARISRALLLRVLAYRIQVDAFGDVSRDTQRLLDRLGSGMGGSPETTTPAAIPPASQWSLKPGTRLDREWQGRMERVMVREDGFAWNGTSYASLSAVAYAITGTKWNGYRFFGLRNGRKIPRKLPRAPGAAGRSVAHQDTDEGQEARSRRGGAPGTHRCRPAVEPTSCPAPSSVGAQP
jgi:hypothetical protein